MCIPSCRRFISISSALKSSDSPVRASAPIFSLVHCFKRSNFLVTFIVVVVVVRRGNGQIARGCVDGELSIRKEVRQGGRGEGKMQQRSAMMRIDGRRGDKSTR
jgi:hypothetical protein